MLQYRDHRILAACFWGSFYAGSGSTKPYRCPGCDQMIPLATPHIVAWLEDDEESRRHWHSACWTKKDKRRPNTERTRNAPRY